jgi:hypothetical protein
MRHLLREAMGRPFARMKPNPALQSDSGAIDCALRALLFDAAAAERKR